MRVMEVHAYQELRSSLKAFLLGSLLKFSYMVHCVSPLPPPSYGRFIKCEYVETLRGYERMKRESRPTISHSSFSLLFATALWSSVLIV